MDMNFNPNGQGVFLLGQLVLDYTNVDGLHNRHHHVRMNTPYTGNGFSGDGPHGHTFNPDAEEFHPTNESKIPLNGNMNPTTAYPEHYEVRVFNTPLATHLQFPQEVPYYGYARPGFQHHYQHHHFVPGSTTILHPSHPPPPPPSETRVRENSNVLVNPDGVHNTVSAPPPPPMFSSTNYARTMDWVPSCGSHICPHIPSPIHVASSVQACPGIFNSGNIIINNNNNNNNRHSSFLNYKSRPSHYHHNHHHHNRIMTNRLKTETVILSPPNKIFHPNNDPTLNDPTLNVDAQEFYPLFSNTVEKRKSDNSNTNISEEQKEYENVEDEYRKRSQILEQTWDSLAKQENDQSQN